MGEKDSKIYNNNRSTKEKRTRTRRWTIRCWKSNHHLIQFFSPGKRVDLMAIHPHTCGFHPDRNSFFILFLFYFFYFFHHRSTHIKIIRNRTKSLLCKERSQRDELIFFVPLISFWWGNDPSFPPPSKRTINSSSRVPHLHRFDCV